MAMVAALLLERIAAGRHSRALLQVLEAPPDGFLHAVLVGDLQGPCPAGAAVRLCPPPLGTSPALHSCWGPGGRGGAPIVGGQGWGQQK